MREHFQQQGTISTTPTDQGNKELDVFHPCYRIKRILNEPISQFFDDDRFIEILQNEKAGFIKLQISLSKESIQEFLLNLENFYIPSDYGQAEHWRTLMSEVLKRLIDQLLVPEITEEIKTELYISSENAVIKKCQESYRSLLMTGPFSCEELQKKTDYDEPRREKRIEDDIIKDRPRCVVMSVILHQIDSNNSVSTVAVVDQYGELVANCDLIHLMPPRKFNPKPQAGLNEDEDQRLKKARLSHKEEEETHGKDKAKIRELISQFQVDLIVVAANKLEARLLKKTLTQIAEDLKNYGNEMEAEDPTKNKKKGASVPEEIREAFVIWGSLEVPKLFASSHQSLKLFKNYHPTLKQAICLARF